MITAEGMAAVDENMAGATLTAVATENATSVTVDDDRFEVAGGNLKLKDGMSLDFEGDDGGSIDVTITATGDGESATHTITVTINDVQEAPTISVRDGEEVPQKGVTSSLTIDENATGADLPPLALIEVMDPDAADATTGQAGADLVTLSGDMADYFEVKLDPENGLWLALKSGASFNFEEHGGSVMVTVTYTDTGGHAASQTVTVTINDVNEAPMADADMEVPDAVFAAGEENSITVDLKGLFSDPDGDTLTYRLSDNAPDWLELSVTVKGTGDGQTITGTISGTPPANSNDMSLDGVMIIASDGDGMESSASFDIIVDAENDAPTRLELRVTEDDGFVVRTDEVDVDENDEGAVLGLLKVTDEDDPRHPHGMHTYTFMVDGEEDDRFEVDMDGNLKLKDDESLNHEDDDEFVLKVTATDKAVGDDVSDSESVSLEITVTVKNVAAADRPVPNRKIGDWWVTVDDDLEAEDVRDGDWLSFRLDTTGDDAAFSHEDGDDLTYSVRVVDGDGNVVDWLQISDSGMMTNKAGMLPDRGVYEVTVTATDEDGDQAQNTFDLAVALSDEGDRDNDTPDIRDVEEFDYMEGRGAQKVASFSVRDDDVAIYPHPYGTLTVTFTATQEGEGDRTTNVANRFKIVEVGRDEDSVHYEIWTRSAAELKLHPMTGKPLPAAQVPKALDFENGDEVDITVTVKDGREEEDDKVITIDLDNAADEAPMFMHSAIDGATRSAATKTTTVKVDQQADKQVIVVQLSEAWEDEDTDDDELDFSIGGKGGLPDWITVYGPDDWEDIYERQRDVDRGDADSTIRDRDIVFAIVIDRSGAGDGNNESLMSASFTVTARDDDGNSATEKIVISVNDVNVDIADDDEDDVVDITGNLAGTGALMMDVDLSLDPDLSGADDDDAILVVYTWMHDNATPADDTDDVTMVSSTPQPFQLLADPDDLTSDRVPVGAIITAKVQYYEIDPVTRAIVQSEEYTDTATVAALPPAGTTPASVSFEVTTDASGLQVDLTTTGPASSAAGQVQLQASSNGTSGWINVDSAAADTSGGSAADLDLDVNEDGDATAGDGGGLYYRVVYSYTANNRTHTEHYDVGRLGDLTGGDPSTTTPAGDIIGGAPGATGGPDVGETLRVATTGEDADVQWQIRDNATKPWADISGATSLTLRVTSAHTGKMLRAKVTYTDDDDPATSGVNEDGWPIWIEYTEVLTVSGADATNDVPVLTGENSEIEVELDAVKGMNQPTKVVTFDASALVHDPDGDKLSYSISTTTAPTPDLDLASDATTAGREVALESGMVWRVHKTEGADDTATDDLEQSLSINPSTGEITYFTDRSHTHDGNADDGAGNVLTFTLSITDNDAQTTAVTPSVTVRINVAPTAIEFGTNPTGEGTGSITNAADTALSDDKAMPTALVVVDDTYDTDAAQDGIQGDTDNDPDPYRIAENVSNQPAVQLLALDVQDENLSGTTGTTGHKYGTHSWKVSDERFEVVRDTDDDGSTWILQLKRGASFDYEKDGNKMGTLVVTITATDGGGLSTSAHFSIQITDVTEVAPPRPPAPDPEPETVPGLEDDADDSDDDGPVIPPDDGSMFIDDLLDQFVISIDDIDVA